MGQKQFFSDTHGTSGSGTSMESVEGKGPCRLPGVVMTAPGESTRRNVLRRRAGRLWLQLALCICMCISIYICIYTYVISAARSHFFCIKSLRRFLFDFLCMCPCHWELCNGCVFGRRAKDVPWTSLQKLWHCRSWTVSGLEMANVWINVF